MATLYPRELKSGISYTMQWAEHGVRKTKALGFIHELEAKKLLLEKELELLNGTTRESINVPLFKDYADEYMTWYAIQNPDSYYRVAQIIINCLNPHFGNFPLDELKLRIGEQYIAKRLKTLKYPNRVNGSRQYIKASTINTELRKLTAMMNRAIDLEILTHNPLKKLQGPQENDSKRPDAFTPEEMQIIYEKASRPHWWKFLANTGMRVSEAQNMVWGWVGDNVISIESTAQRRTKSGKWREVPITDNVRAALEMFRKEKDDTEALLLKRKLEAEEALRNYKPKKQRKSNKSSKRPRRSTLQYHQRKADRAKDRYEKFRANEDFVFPVMDSRSFSRAAINGIEEAGLTGSAHKFRHTFCTNHIANGTPLSKVQYMAGHSTSKVTEKYIHLTADHVSELNVNI